ncbi:MAG: amidase [Chitinophagaceae bacterium]|nr:amidase [Chitinophagaceae bacterium]MCO5287685.1 amidase [Chitinophagaceae bacterium]MCW5914501.1 amidase [Chitinophagaceae bacterium]MCZ2395397.1 amidase [Chitinophagales bacterium]HRP17244.1 amidase [Ginsengibacter sp.]
MKYLVISAIFSIAFLFCRGQQTIDTQDIHAASKIISMDFTTSEADSMLGTLQSRARVYHKMHQYNLANATPLTLTFSPLLPDMKQDNRQRDVKFHLPTTQMPANRSELAFYSIPQLASLIKSRKISSVALTKFFINRLKKFGDTLHCVISITEDIAMKEAAEADKEIAAGKYRGLLHGIPYGLKDLFAVKGTKTTWGAAPYKDQILDADSYVYTKLREAGAVLVAKLSTGALAMGDYWYGGRTRNPWNLQTGSSGSSAGPASATVAGLVPFAIGTETYGSIISPSVVCGATGLRPTFGAISRSGAMTLSWSLDKAGPLCRSAEDAAVVFYYLHGTDGLDASAIQMPFNYKEQIDLSKLRIGYAVNYFPKKDTTGNEYKVLEVLRSKGAHLIPMNFPDSGIYNIDMIGLVIGSEASAAFDAFTRTGLDDLMTNQGKGEWPNYFRASRFIPAAEYVNVNRHRYILMQKVNAVLRDYDVIICPSWGGNQLAITNLTGHPAVALPNGFNKAGMPTSITFVGNLYDEATLLAVAKAYQDATEWNKKHPEMFMSEK